MEAPPFRAEHIGSLLRPRELVEGEEDEAIARVIRWQEQGRRIRASGRRRRSGSAARRCRQRRAHRLGAARGGKGAAHRAHRPRRGGVLAEDGQGHLPAPSYLHYPRGLACVCPAAYPRSLWCSTWWTRAEGRSGSGTPALLGGHVTSACSPVALCLRGCLDAGTNRRTMEHASLRGVEEPRVGELPA